MDLTILKPHLTVHLGTQPVMLWSWIHLAWSALVSASLYLLSAMFYLLMCWVCLCLVMSSLAEQEVMVTLPGAEENQSR